VSLCTTLLIAPDVAWACLENFLEAVGYKGSMAAFIYSWVFPSPHMGECMWAAMSPEAGDHWEHMVYSPTMDPRSVDMPLPCSSSLCLQARFVPIESQFSDVLWQSTLWTLGVVPFAYFGLVVLEVVGPPFCRALGRALRWHFGRLANSLSVPVLVGLYLLSRLLFDTSSGS
jgi:hypothetical protein